MLDRKLSQVIQEDGLMIHTAKSVKWGGLFDFKFVPNCLLFITSEKANGHLITKKPAQRERPPSNPNLIPDLALPTWQFGSCEGVLARHKK
jgi:hypothetical protein